MPHSSEVCVLGREVQESQLSCDILPLSFLNSLSMLRLFLKMYGCTSLWALYSIADMCAEVKLNTTGELSLEIRPFIPLYFYTTCEFL